MSAIITTNFRLENANNFRAAISAAGNSVYAFIGKSDKWGTTLADTSDTPTTAVDTQVETNDARQNMIAAKQITASDVINLAPRYNWNDAEANVFVPWDDADSGIWSQMFYCITDEFKVYKCIKSPGTKSTVKPTGTTYVPEAYGDGYTWKYMYTVQSVYQKFLTNNYMPVKQVLEAPSGGSADEGQWMVQTNSMDYAGYIYRGVVVNGGTGYNPALPPAVTIYGDGTGATATASVSVGGIVTGINITNPGSNYSVAYATIAAPVSGTTATCRVVLSPKNGHGTDPVSELGAFYTGLTVSLLRGDGSGDFIVDNAFRQIGIIKNPYDFGTTDVSSSTTLSALKGLQLSAHSGLVNGDYMTGDVSGAIAYIDSYDSAGGIVKYHQNDKTGYIAFQLGEGITGHTQGSGTIAAVDGLLDPELERFSGEVLFLENRLPINRTAQQIEDIKIVIEF